MTDSRRRLLVAVCFLAALWVLVYWLWQPSRPAIRFDRASPDAPAGEPAPRASDPQPTAPPIGRASPGVPDVAPPRSTPADRPAIRDPLGEIAIQPDRIAPPVAPPRYRDYTIQSGDTFERLAERELGSRARVAEIVDANPGKDPRRLRIGDVIRLPTSNSPGQPAAPTPSPTTPGPTPALPGNPAGGVVPSTYTVRRGDTLSVISQTLYGTSRHAGAIFEANRDQLRSADDIREGQVLRIPPRPE